MLRLYYWAGWLLSPAILLWLLYRLARGKEDPQRFRERVGLPGMPRPQGRLIWIHAASVGEAMSALPLVSRLHDADPGAYIMLTTGTRSSARLIGPRLPMRAFHHYVPVDLPFAVARFMAHWQPDCAVWVESEFWPNLLRAAQRSGAPMALINARLSERSARRWQRARHAFAELMQGFTLKYAGSPDDQARCEALGLHLENVGNLKFDALPLPADSHALDSLRQAIGQRPVWLAASTHPGEEEQIAAAHRLLRQRFPDLLTILAPRHPPRGDAIAALLGDLPLRRRSLGESIEPATQLYLADTLGELGLFYRLCPIVCIGGSLVPHGGHNPIEPAQLGCALLCGPHMHNFSAIAQQLDREEALCEVADAESLARVIAEWFDHPAKRLRAGEAARQAVAQRSGAVDRIAPAVLALLHPPAREAA